jgi:hypothetical protein
MTISAIAAIVSNNSNGKTVKTIFPGNVSRFQLRPMTVIRNCLATRRTSRGQGAREQRSERSPSYVSDEAQRATPASAVPRVAVLTDSSLVDAAHDGVE